MRLSAAMTIGCVCLAGSVAQDARAEIVSATPAGFSIRHVVEAPSVSPPTVWAALADIGKWWDPEHTYSQDARNLTLDMAVRGCLCERTGLYAGVEHAHVIYVQPPKMLRLSGALGPLQQFGVNGALTWQIEVAGGGSRITLTYNVGGYADRPLSEWAPLVDEVLSTQAKRFGRFITTGSPEAAKP